MQSAVEPVSVLCNPPWNQVSVTTRGGSCVDRESTRKENAPGSNGVPGGQRTSHLFRERLDGYAAQLPCHARPRFIPPAITQLTKRPSASMPTGVAPRSAETLRTRSPCGLVHVAVGCQHQSEAQNPRKADLPRLAVRDNVFVSTRRENMAFAGNGQVRFFPTPVGRGLPANAPGYEGTLSSNRNRIPSTSRTWP
jgi:hypothetical protein